MRGWFEARGFTEVETGALVVSPGAETHLHAFSTDLQRPDGTRRRLHLHTSPEFACKKLLAAGEREIFTLARVWRNRERGALHAPEFTLLEWYRAEAPWTAVADDALDLLRLAAETAGAARLGWRGRACDPFADAERITVAEAFDRWAGLDLLATVDAEGRTDRDALHAAVRGLGVRTAPDDTWSDLFSRVLVDRIDPQLGEGRPTVLYEYPVAEAALARRAPYDGRVAERFELFACGVELANAFGELTDPREQRRRFEAEMAERDRIYGETYPVDEELLTALNRMPEAAGAALGFDRLVMLATGATDISQVLWTPAPG